MFQRAMSVPIGKNPSKDLVVSILKNSFQSMESLGDAVIRPFLQDVLQFRPLAQTLFNSGLQDPLTPLKIIPHVGVIAIADFVYHMINLLWFTFLSENIAPSLSAFVDGNPSMAPSDKFKYHRMIEQWKFGSGLDYNDHM